MIHTALRTILGGAVIVLAVVSTQPAFSQEADRNSGDDRAFLQYEMQKVDPWGPFALNLLLGLGIGSFVQGDTTGGLLVAGGEVVGAGLLIAWLSNPESGNALLIGGVVLLSAARIAGLVIPFTYANGFNEKLRKDLGIAISDVSLIVPGVNGEADDGYGVNVTFTRES